MRRLLDRVATSPAFNGTLQSLRSNGLARITGCAGSLCNVVGALLYQRLGEPVLLVFEDRADADAAYADLTVLLGSEHALLYQEDHHSRATLRESIDADVASLTDALTLLSENPVRAIVTDVESLAEAVPPRARVAGSIITLQRGERISFEDFTVKLALGGFDRVEIVQSVGEFAVRGGIVDVHPAGSDHPVRVEFFGDEIDSIREFDPLSQRSVRELETLPLMAKLFHADDADQFTATLLDYLSPSTLLLLDEPERLDALLREGEHADVADRLEQFPRLLHSIVVAEGNNDILSFESRSQPGVGASMREFCKAIDTLRADGATVIVMTDGEEARQRFEEMIDAELDRAADEGVEHGFAVSDLVWEAETLSAGFILPGLKFAALTEHEAFERRRSRARRRARQFKGFTLRELRQLRPGDFVVHVDKGIGRFVGLETIQAAGNTAEAVKLEYAGGDTLFVNLTYINRLQKYSSKEGAQPKLSKLGTEEWERAKARAKKRVKDIARELIRLYAMRRAQPGYAFPTDTPWQRELEASFMYEDTPDQASATADVKGDMERPTPMDRLVCGDVGFGKTEVAVRAAFKAVQAGRQVAVLCPTTILAQQHYNTFRDRLARYAVNVDLLSRFRTKPDQKETVEKLKRGAVDILIGTHRLLSKDVVFRDLGLLIIDEEQRFGVASKEKLRQLRATVDTLTLTATPIPRTLNFSLMGARDLSVIETPPRNRLPIHTELMQWSDDVIVEAIRREMRRGGQCFMVHWRVGDIDDLAAQISALVPEARVTTVHGSMTAEQIEKTMVGFIERRFDVLVATKIIESGIDIPAANTMIVNRADTYGLAELYQLRGRVGRSNIQAYCLMIVPSPATLSRIALRRLQAIQEMTDLGSGLKLAMRDLEIRGAGNLLGGEQSGYIEEIGFDLYQRIVDDAVEELKREEFRDLFADQIAEEDRAAALPVNEDVTVEMEGEALIPKRYIADAAERYDVYLRLYTSRDRDALTGVLSEMRDRFGPIPEETERLVEAVRLRIAAMPTGAHRLGWRDSTLRLELPNKAVKDFYDRWFQPMMAALADERMAHLETQGKTLAIRYDKVPSVEEAERLLARLVDRMRQNRRESLEANTSEQ